MAETRYFPFDVKWSSKLEKLADALSDSWRQAVDDAADPFGKICVVVNDSSTENWLKQYFLLDRKIRQVMMNLEFVKLPEFVNDWLAAEVHHLSPKLRRAADHPYSPDVLVWRIYRILMQTDKADRLQELTDYIGKGQNGGPDHLKCLALSGKLAELYDDYLNSRSRMLRNWEKGLVQENDDVPLWQSRLYQLLYAENAQSYAADYEKAFTENQNGNAAVSAGFPRYLAVHVFDIPFMPEPVLHLLERFSASVPVTFWTFNPQADEWLGESSSKTEAIRQLRDEWQNQRRSLQDEGRIGDDGFGTLCDCDSPEERLFGALASGARPIIRNLCSDSDGRVEVIGQKEALEELKEREIRIHSTYSPRRELETVKDGLLDFFAKHDGMALHNAVVLCADWENYAPIIDAVFSSSQDSEGFIPITVAGGTAGDTPFGQSFKNLLEFRENRFEADAVWELLGTPAVQAKFGLDEDSLGRLREMVKNANIRWGYDDADVRQILQMDAGDSGSHYPFTWQRGMDRMIAEWLHGFREDEYTMLDVGKSGRLRPCGEVEGDRCRMLAKLWDCVEQLHQMRVTLAPGKEYSPNELRDILQNLIRQFYTEPDAQTGKDIRLAVQTIGVIARRMTKAHVDSCRTEVFIAALLEAMDGCASTMRTPGDSVLFAPLNCSTAMPHELVWICGLNDGAFPRIGHRASYDVIGRHPSLWDVGAREKDAFALLKAALGARTQLCFSYVGKDIHTNDTIPPSVLLNDLKDYFTAQQIPFQEYGHPMHAYSRRYFTAGAEKSLPPNYSARNEEIARQLMNRQGSKSGPVPFPLDPNAVTEIRLEDLADFFAAPNQYLFRLQGIKVPGCWDDRPGKECLSVKLDKQLQKELRLNGCCPESAAQSQIETGNAPDECSAQDEIRKVSKAYDRALSEALYRFQQTEPLDAAVGLTVRGCSVIVRMRWSAIEYVDEKKKTMIYYDHYWDSNTAKNKVRLNCLGANAVAGGISAVLFGPGKKTEKLSGLPVEEAKRKLTELVAMAGSPLPADFPDYRKTSPKDDLLPPEWQKRLDALFPDPLKNKDDDDGYVR